MSLSLCAHPRDNAVRPSAPSIRGRRTTATMAVAAPVILAYSWVEDVPNALLSSPLALGVVAAVAVPAGLVLLVRGRASRPRSGRSGTDACLDLIEQLHVTGPLDSLPGPSEVPPAPHDDTSASPEPPHVKALRMQVRALERALEEQMLCSEQQDPQPPAGGDLDRVRVVIGALRDRFGDTPDAARVLNRVEAAVARLDESGVPGRPVLPPPVTTAPGAAPSSAAPSSAALSAAAPTVPASTTAPQTGAAPSAEVPTAAPSTAADEIPAEVAAPAADPEPVLPVPAPPPQPPRRTRGWRRRVAA